MPANERIIFDGWAILKADGQIATLGNMPLIGTREDLLPWMKVPQVDGLRVARIKTVEVVE